MKRTHLSYRALSELFRELAMFSHAGANSATAVALLAEQCGNAGLKSALEGICGQIDSGLPLSQALSASGLIPAEGVSMLAVGEASGRSEETLFALAEHYSSLDSTDTALRRAVVFPTAVLAVMLAVSLLLTVYVLPIFEEVYASLGGELTGISAAMLSLGRAIGSAAPVLFGLIALIPIFLCVFILSPAVRDRLFGFDGRSERGVGRALARARFAEGFALSLSGGLDPENAIRTSGELLASKSARRACERCLELIREGCEVWDALSRSGLFTPAQCRLLFLGMKGGDLESAARGLAQKLRADAESALETAVGRIEPIAVAVSCAAVGLILISVMLPLTELISSIG